MTGMPVALLAVTCGAAMAPGVLLAQGSNDPSARAARISYVSGNVSFQPSGDAGWSLATLNYPMTTGDRLFADQGGRAELQVGPVAVRLADASDLTVTYLSDQLVQLGLAQGTVRVSVYQLSPGDTVEVDTPYGALTLLAPGDYRIDAPAGDAAMLVTVERGSLEWAAGGVAQTVEDGQAIRVSGMDPIQVASAAPAPADGFEQWAAQRDGRLASSQSAQYVSRDIPGYDDLDDAGTWQQEADYGPVWYPAGMSSDWAPYRNGSWVWVEPWGWTWVEQEPWGYAPFHYGRWVNVNARWGWLPGPIAVRSYYAPALVVFVNGSSFGMQAWFPLGPGETYYPSYRHDDDYFRRVNVTNMRNVSSVTVNVNVNAINYRNRERATTAVATADFQSGQHVRGTMPGRDADVARAPIQPRPAGAPSGRAAAGGPPAPRPPEVARPVFVTTPSPRAAPRARPDAPLVVPRTEPTPHAGPVVITRRPPPDVPHAADRRPTPAPAVPAPAPVAPRPNRNAPDRAVPAPNRIVPEPAAPMAPRPNRGVPDRAVPTPYRPVPATAPTPVTPKPNRAAPSPARAVPAPNRTMPVPASAPTPVAPKPNQPNRGVPARDRAAPTPNRNAPTPAAPAARPDRAAPTPAAPAARPDRAAPTPAAPAARPDRAAPTPNPNASKRPVPAQKHAPDKPAPKPDSTRGPTHR
jgi:hypothetical protein